SQETCLLRPASRHPFAEKDWPFREGGFAHASLDGDPCFRIGGNGGFSLWGRDSPSSSRLASKHARDGGETMDKRWKLRETGIRDSAAMLWIALSRALRAACGAGSAGSGADGADGQAQGAAAQRSEAAAGTDPGAASGTEPDAAVETETRPDQGADGAGGKRTVYPLTVTDATGAQVTLEAAPRRIVSTSPSETEILFALGLGDRIVAVSDYDNYP